MNVSLIRDACLGFSGPADYVVSLNVPLATEDGQNSSYHSFDIEYDSEQPDTLTIRLLELDQHGFNSTALHGASFPALLRGLLASKQKDTHAQFADHGSIADED